MYIYIYIYIHIYIPGFFPVYFFGHPPSCAILLLECVLSWSGPLSQVSFSNVENNQVYACLEDGLIQIISTWNDLKNTWEGILPKKTFHNCLSAIMNETIQKVWPLFHKRCFVPGKEKGGLGREGKGVVVWKNLSLLSW